MTKAELRTTGRDYTDEDILSFVRDLTVSSLVCCGRRPIAPLKEFLPSGTPRGLFLEETHER